MSKKWADWVEGSTNPTGHEVGRLVQPIDPELVEAAVDATAPLDSELNRLLMSRAKAKLPEPGAFDWWGFESRQLGGAAAAAAALIAASTWFAMPASYGEVGSPLGEIAEWQGDFELGPSIDVHADGTLRVAQADREGTVVELLDGTAEFSVDPGGIYRHLVVLADGVEVEVKGTVFDVTVDDGNVWVDCTRGKVEIRYAGTEFFVAQADSKWSSADMALNLVEAEDGRRRVAKATAEPEQVPEAVVRTVAPGAEPLAASEDVVDEGTDVEGLEGEEVDENGPSFTRLERDMSVGRHSPEKMVELWEVFIDSNPDSLQLDEARLNRLLTLGGYKQDDATLNQIDDFLATNPRRDLYIDAKLISIAISYEAQGDCETALQASREVLSMTEGAEAGYVSAVQGMCEKSDAAKRVGLERAMQLGLDNRRLQAEVIKELSVLDDEESRGKRGGR